MIDIFVDKVSVLGLTKHETKIKTYFDSIFHKDQLNYCFKPGVGANSNDGQMTSSLWSILNHNTVDRVSKDIFQNHIEMIRNAYMDPTVKYLLMLEDDARFPQWDQTKWDEIQTWLVSNTTQWDIFYMGYCNWPCLWSIFMTRYIVKVSSPLATHSYILNRRGMYKILSWLDKNPSCSKLHIDKYFLQIPHFQKLAAFPMVSFQETCPGLYLKACDKLKVRVLFSTCCKWNERVSVLVPIIFVFLFVFLILYTVNKQFIKK